MCLNLVQACMAVVPSALAAVGLTAEALEATAMPVEVRGEVEERAGDTVEVDLSEGSGVQAAEAHTGGGGGEEKVGEADLVVVEASALLATERTSG